MYVSVKKLASRCPRRTTLDVVTAERPSGFAGSPQHRGSPFRYQGYPLIGAVSAVRARAMAGDTEHGNGTAFAANAVRMPASFNQSFARLDARSLCLKGFVKRGTFAERPAPSAYPETTSTRTCGSHARTRSAKSVPEIPGIK